MALAYREASKQITTSGRANVAWVSRQVMRVDGANPTKESLSEFFAKVDADPEWFPGKHNGKKRGPAPLLTTAKRRAVATCAMRIKSRGDEPTAEEIIQRCPASTTNPVTGKPFDLKRIRNVFATDCYDLDPESPWRFQARSSRCYLPPKLMEHRVACPPATSMVQNSATASPIRMPLLTKLGFALFSAALDLRPKTLRLRPDLFFDFLASATASENGRKYMGDARAVAIAVAVAATNREIYKSESRVPP